MGRKPVDWTGIKVGKLTPLHLIERRSGGNCYWLCQCDCGNTIEVSASNLRSQHVTSCGCWKDNNITNRRFDNLIALEPTELRTEHDGSIIWKCLCDCGNICFKGLSDLKTSTNNSCGCSKTTKSRGEEKINEILLTNNIHFEREKSFTSCRFDDTNRLARFDFYIENKYIIEFDGPQHQEHSDRGWFTEKRVQKIQWRDKIKNQWCKENNVPLIRIPYTHLNNIKLEDLLLETSNFIYK